MNRVFYPFQSQALLHLQRPGHVVCVAPTGSGKSLIFEEYLRQNNPRCWIISPLVALSRQHEKNLKKIGLSVCTPSHLQEEIKAPNESKIWILSPESGWLSEDRHPPWAPDLLVVDECHCIWDWGDHFRPAFKKIPHLIQRFSIPKSLWLTATLTHAARTQLLQSLPGPIHSIGQFGLPANLRISCFRVPWIRRSQFVLDWISQTPDSGILFAMTREWTQKLSRLLRASGQSVLMYHAGLSREERLHVEISLSEQKKCIVVATSAFGMGMNFPGLKWALLWQMPPSFLYLAQAIGRVGRNGAAGEAVLLWDHDDPRLIEWAVMHSSPRKTELQQIYQFYLSNDNHLNMLHEHFRG